MKLYCPLTVQQAERILTQTPTTDSALGAARVTLDALRAKPRSDAAHRDTHFLQLSSEGDALGRKVFFPCATWGLTEPEGFRRLVTHLDKLGVGLEPLGFFFDVFGESGIRVAPTYVALSGPATEPSVTFYVSPVSVEAAAVVPDSKAPTGRSTREDVIAAGVEFLKRCQESDGGWSDIDLPAGTDADDLEYVCGGPGDIFTTAYVACCLARVPSARGLVTKAASKLRQSVGPDGGWGWNVSTPTDTETTALASTALAAASLSAKVRRNGPSALGWVSALGVGADVDPVPLASPRSPDVAAAVLSASFDMGADMPLLSAMGRDLIKMQRSDGRWDSDWWSSDLVATVRAVEALTRVRDSLDDHDRVQPPSHEPLMLLWLGRSAVIRSNWATGLPAGAQSVVDETG